MKTKSYASALRKVVAKMNREMYSRIKTAAEYQKKAIRALFPQKVSGHLDAIEKEIKMMAAEIISDLVSKDRKDDHCQEADDNKQTFKVKKVEIL